MIIKEQRGKKCPKGYRMDKATGYATAEGAEMVVGDLPCEECSHFKFKTSDRVNQQGVKLADEFCELLLEKEEVKDE